MKRALQAVVCLTAVAVTSAASAVTYRLPDEGDVIGAVREVRSQAKDTLLDIARRHNVGFEEIRLANPGVDAWLPGEGTTVLVPSLYVLPHGPRRGIVLNLAEMRVFYYPRPKRGQPPTVTTHPVSIGRMDWATPLGTTKVIGKVRNPAWYPPESIRAEHAANGDPLPRVVPAGPENPLGDFAMRLGIPGYLIHGTNKPYGIGMRVSHGCVRMYPEDIARLFGRVGVGTPVHIVNQPVKAGWRDGHLYVEVHPTTGEMTPDGAPDPTESVRQIVEVTPPERTASVSWARVNQVLGRLNGVPDVVTDDGLALTLASGIDTKQPAKSPDRRRSSATPARVLSPAAVSAPRPVLRRSNELSRTSLP